MKIGLAQLQPVCGNIQKNRDLHIAFVEGAMQQGLHLVLFPELSLTGYEPKMAMELAMEVHDPRLEVFQDLSDQGQLTIGLGIPEKTSGGTMISTLFFQPHKPRKRYSKQQLHPDEAPYFIHGHEQLILSVGHTRLAPAICYESLQEGHMAAAKKQGAEGYLASVAKPQRVLEKAFLHYPKMAKDYAMPVFMVNAIGACDDFISAGQTCIWDKEGKVLGQLEADEEGLLICDLETDEVCPKPNR